MPPQFKTIICHKVTENPYLMEKKVRAHVGNTLGKFLLGIVILMFVMNVIPLFLSLLLPTSMSDVIAHFSSSVDKQVIAQMPRVPVVCYFYALLFNGVLKLGEALYTLTYIRNRQVDFRALGEGMNYYFKALGVFVAQTVIISIWSMLFVIPGVIAAINFSQSYYLLAEDPNRGVFEVLAESKIRMRGNRMTYVKMLLAFCPAVCLGAIPALLGELFLTIDTTTAAGLAVNFCLNVTFYCGLGYVALGQCTFYELLLTGGFDKFRFKGQDAFRAAEVQLEDKSE